MNPFDKYLEEAGITYDELTPDEKQVYQSGVLNIKTLSIDDIISLFGQLKYFVEVELTDTPDDDVNRDKNCKLKARLKNYLIFENFLIEPKRKEAELRKRLKDGKSLAANPIV